MGICAASCAPPSVRRRILASAMQRPARTSHSQPRRFTMPEMNSLHALFEKELRDLYDAEKQIVKALPKIIKSTTNDELNELLSVHLEETKGHVDRLEGVFESVDMTFGLFEV